MDTSLHWRTPKLGTKATSWKKAQLRQLSWKEKKTASVGPGKFGASI